MADVDALDALEEIDAATERARECADHLWAAAGDRRAAADVAFELTQALRRVTDETAGLRAILAGSPMRGRPPVGSPLDRLDPAGGRS